MPIYTDNKTNILYDHDYGPVAWMDPSGEMISGYKEKTETKNSGEEFFTEYKTKKPIQKILGNTNIITDETYKSGLVTPYDTIKTNQIIPNGIINLTLTTSSVTSENVIGDYISKWLTVEQRVGHKVYARIINSDNRVRVCWYKGYTSSGKYASGYDFITGQLLDETSSPSEMKEGIYTITQDMVWSDGYAQLYWYKFTGLPAGTHTITLQMCDLTEAYGAGNEPNNLVTLKSQHPELNNVNEYGYRLIGAGENPNSHNLPAGYEELEYIEANDTSGFISTSTVKTTDNIKVKISLSNNNSSVAVRVGSYSVGNLNAIYVNRKQDGTYALGYTCQYSQPDFISNLNYSNLIKYGTPMILEFRDQKAYIDGTRIYSLLFKNVTSTFDTVIYSNSRLYKIQVNNVDRFIPCIRKSDNEHGMYDTSNETFYPNNKSGSFIAGPVVNRYEITTNDGTIIPLSAPLYKIDDVADTARTSVGENRKFGVVDLGDLDWALGSYNNVFITGNNTMPRHETKIICDRYEYQYEEVNIQQLIKDKHIAINTTGRLVLKNLAFSDADILKQSLKGVKLIYELETPTQTLFPEPYKLASLTSVTDGLKQLALSEVRDEYVKHLENVDKVEYRGKNLVNIPETTKSVPSYYIGTSDTSGNRRRINLKAGTYILSFKWTGGGYNEIIIRNKNQTELVRVSMYIPDQKTYKKVITLSEDAAWIAAYFNNNSGGTLSDIMIEEGSTATPFEPYFEPAIFEQLDLNGIDNYIDSIDINKNIAQENKQIESVKDMSLLNWYVVSETPYRLYGVAVPSISQITNVICPLYESTLDTIAIGNSPDYNRHITNAAGTIILRDDGIMSVENLKQILKDVPMCYVTEKEIIDISNTQNGNELLNLKTHPNQTHILDIDGEGRVAVNYCVYRDNIPQRLKTSDLKLFVTSDHKDFYTK